MPINLGTVGGAVVANPCSQLAMTILRHPNKNQLQQLVVAAGLLQNFAALDALANQGIVQGHMRLHITNLIAELGITDQARVDWLRSQTTAHLRQQVGSV